MRTYELEQQITDTKDRFIQYLKANLNLIKVEAPLFVEKGTGVNDDLNGSEHAVSFTIDALPNRQFEIVHSLAKWKRQKLGVLGALPGEGIYADMRALRTSEELSALHSVYVDQWDWEKVIAKEERNLDQLKKTVLSIYASIYATAVDIRRTYGITHDLPEQITFLHAEDVYAKYPHLTAKERENEICKQYGAVFLIGIGGALQHGEPHDGRAPDYDDWTSETAAGYAGLNGDLLLWNTVLDRAIEISSMGIRVNKEALERQLEISGNEERVSLKWHQALLREEMPQTIGGGIGQSRLVMYLLKKSHIGEVQNSAWDTKQIAQAQLLSSELN